MGEVNFLTPVCFRKEDITFFEKLVKTSDRVLSIIGNKKFRVVLLKSGDSFLEKMPLEPRKKGWSQTALLIIEIISKILFIPLALVIKGIHHKKWKVEVEKTPVDDQVRKIFPDFEQVLEKAPKTDKVEMIKQINNTFAGFSVDLKDAEYFQNVLKEVQNPVTVFSLFKHTYTFSLKTKVKLLEVFRELASETLEQIRDLQLPKSFFSFPDIWRGLSEISPELRRELVKEHKELGVSLFRHILRNTELWTVYKEQIKGKFKKLDRALLKILLERPELVDIYKELESNNCPDWIMTLAKKGNVREAVLVLSVAKKVAGERGMSEEFLKKIHRIPRSKREELPYLYKSIQAFDVDFPHIVNMTRQEMVHFVKSADGFSTALRKAIAEQLPYIPERKWDVFIERVKRMPPADIALERIAFETCNFNEKFFDQFKRRDEPYLAYMTLIPPSERQAAFNITYRMTSAKDLKNAFLEMVELNKAAVIASAKGLIDRTKNYTKESARIYSYYQKYYDPIVPQFPRDGFIINDEAHRLWDGMRERVITEEFFYPVLKDESTLFTYKTEENEREVQKTVRLAFNFDNLRNVERVRIFGSDLPKDVKLEKFNAFVAEHKLEGSFERIRDYLSINYGDDDVVTYGQYCLRYILKLCFDQKDGAALVKFVKHIRAACSVGVEDDFQTYYNDKLTAEQRLGKLNGGGASEQPVLRMAQEVLDRKFKQEIDNLDFWNYEGNQGAHESRYAQGRLAHQTGLGPILEVDPYPFCISQRAQQTTTEEYVNLFFNHYTVKKYIEDLQLELKDKIKTIQEKYQDTTNIIEDMMQSYLLEEGKTTNGSLTNATNYFVWSEDYTEITGVRTEFVLDLVKSLRLVREV